MAIKVTELYIRRDWGFVKFAYLPAIILSVLAIKFVPFLAAITARISVRIGCAPCAVCACLNTWGNHVEEWYHRKPLLQAEEYGLTHENGGLAQFIPWSSVKGIVVHRRISPWQTGGHAGFVPPYWMTVEYEDDDGVACRIAVWPRAIAGGLMHIYRFARTMQTCLQMEAQKAESGTV
jgi:hypothetical protein